MPDTSMDTSRNSPKRTRLHVIWSCLLISICVTFAGFIAVWLFSLERHEKILSIGMTAGALLLALLQYFSTFRYHREAAIVAMWLNGILGVILSLVSLPILLFSVIAMMQNVWLLAILVQGTLVMILIMFIINASYHLQWSTQLYQAKQSNCSPIVPSFVTLREIFLLLLVISWVFAITSFGLRHGWQHLPLM